MFTLLVNTNGMTLPTIIYWHYEYNPIPLQTFNLKEHVHITLVLNLHEDVETIATFSNFLPKLY